MTRFTYPIPVKSPLHRKIINKLDTLIKWGERAHGDLRDRWRKSEESMMAYVPESETDRRRAQRREVDGAPQYTTITLPYSYAVALSAHTYFTSVLFNRTPILQFMGRHGEPQMNVMAVEALIDYQVGFGGAAPIYYSWIYDKTRFGLGWIKTNWEKQVRHVASLVEPLAAAPVDPAAALMGEAPAGTSAGGGLQLKIEDVEVYEGNVVKNVSPFNLMTDPRVSLQDYQKGEFLIEMIDGLGWHHVKERERQGFYMNLEHVRTNFGTGERRTYQGEPTRRRPIDYMFSPDYAEGQSVEGGSTRSRPGALSLYEVYVHLIPSEWGLGDRDYAELWCITVTQDLTLIIGATPIGYYHAQFPYTLGKIDFDPYSLDARGFPEQLETVQQTMDWLLNTHFYNIRGALQNTFIVDTTRVNLADLEDPLPGGIVRVRSEAAGMDVRNAVYQIPIQDVTRQHLGELPMMQAIGERIVGMNDSVLGTLSGSDRKTATEVRTNTSFSVNRLRTLAEFNALIGVQHHAQMMLQNSQQLYTAMKKLRIAGDSAATGTPKFLDVSRESIAGFYDFVPINGTLPSDPLAEAKMIQELIMNFAQFPQFAMQFDLTRMLSYGLMRAGIKNINQFRVDIQPDELVAAAVTRGNAIPLRSPASRTPQPGNATGASGPIV